MNLYINFIPQAVLASVALASWDLPPPATVPPRSGVVEHSIQFGISVGPVRDRIGPNLLISGAGDARARNEPTIFIDPADPLHIVGGCNDYRVNAIATCGWFVTFDGGENWQDGVVEGLDVFRAAGDPSVAVDREGTVYLCGIHWDNNQGGEDGGIFIARSGDGGLDWDAPHWVIVHRDENNPPFEDKPFLTVDNSGGEYDGALYVSWTRYGTGQIYFSRSADRGENWSDPLRLYIGRGQGSLPVVGPDGELYIFWVDYSESRIAAVLSEDGGESFSDVFAVAPVERLPDVLEPTQFRVNSIPTADADRSGGELRGRVYVAWADHSAGDADILLVWSDDRGDHWSDPVRLNDDEAGNGIDQFFPWLSVDPATGELSALWYDRRLDEDNILIDLFGARWNGVDEIPNNERISNESSDPRIGFQGRFIGDYNGIAAFRGRGHPVWCDTREGNQDIFYTQFEGESHFSVAGGERRHSFTALEITIDGAAPDEGDELAVIDAGGSVVGMSPLSGEPPYEFDATGDWEIFDRVTQRGYMRFLVWDESEWRERSCAPVVTEGLRFLRDGAATTLSLICPPPDRQEITLVPTWNIISTRLAPISLSHWDLFAPVLGEVIRIRDEDGRFLVPELGFSNLLPFEVVQGYHIGVSDTLTVRIEGIAIDPQTPVPIDEGWNFIAYLPPYPLDPWDAFDGIIDDLILAKDDFGRFMAPELNFSNLPPLSPGKGYHVKVRGDVELVFPEEGDRIAALPEAEILWHFTPPRRTQVNMSLLITSVDGFGARAGGELAVINGAGAVCGAVVLQGHPPWGVAVWGSDGDDGMKIGEMLSFLYRSEETRGLSVLLQAQTSRALRFEPDGLATVQLVHAAGSAAIHDRPRHISVSPNPFNESTTVAFNLPSAAADLRLVDIQGRVVREARISAGATGLRSVVVDGADLGSGCYFVVVEAGGARQMQRVVLMR